jgi:hypothetical protein
MKGKNVIDAVQKMRPTVYSYSGELDDGVEHFGFIAQDLERLFPIDKFGVVTEDGHGNKMVRYHEIIPMLVKYVHHIEKRVSKLEDVEE